MQPQLIRQIVEAYGQVRPNLALHREGYPAAADLLSRIDRDAVEFLLAMQAADGGFTACAGSPESDLLSTFTALVTLFALDGLQRVNLGAAVRFIGPLAGAEGGFRATPSDPETDLEYTFYGLGALGIIRVYVELMKSFS